MRQPSFWIAMISEFYQITVNVKDTADITLIGRGKVTIYIVSIAVDSGI